MPARQELLRFLQQNNINVTLPPRLNANERDNEIAFLTIHSICLALLITQATRLNNERVKFLNNERANKAAFLTIHSIYQKLITPQASLLNKETFEILLRTAQNSNFIGERVSYFKVAIDFLNEKYAENHVFSHHDIFHAICLVTNSTLADSDINYVLISIIELHRLNLLTQENIRLLVDSLINEPPQSNIGLQKWVIMEELTIPGKLQRADVSRAEQLYDWLSHRREISQEDFNLMIRTKAGIRDTVLYMKKLDAKGLKTLENCQALADARFMFDRGQELPPTQLELNAFFLRLFYGQLSHLSAQYRDLRKTNSEFEKYFADLYLELETLSLHPEVRAAPHELIHITAVILNVLPRLLPRDIGTLRKADTHELIALGNQLKGHSSPCRQKAGQIMIDLSKALQEFHTFVEKLIAAKTSTSENFPVMVETEVVCDLVVDKLLPRGQLKSYCGQKLDQLAEVVRYLSTYKNQGVTAIHQHAFSLHQRLVELSQTREVRTAPDKFRHTLAVVLRALPAANYKPSKADIEELIVLANEAQGEPSPAWQRVGKIMMALGGAIALAVGIILTFTTVGIASPLGIGLAAAGIAGGASLLAGFGIFTHAKMRTGISKDMVNLATEVEKLETPIAEHPKLYNYHP